MKMVDDELSWRKLMVGESVRPRSLAVGSGSGWVLHVEETDAVILVGSDDDEWQGRWRSTVSTGGAASVAEVGANQ
jgi:hypothetical protein